MRKIAIAAMVVAFGTIGLAAPAHAAPAHAAADKPRANVGYCVSDFIYGNQPNRDAEGDIVPSQSPGPKKTLPDGSVVAGNSVGDYNSGRATGERVNLPQGCRAALAN